MDVSPEGKKKSEKVKITQPAAERIHLLAALAQLGPRVTVLVSAPGQCWVTGGDYPDVSFLLPLFCLVFRSSAVKYPSFLTILHFRKRLRQLYNAKLWYTL